MFGVPFFIKVTNNEKISNIRRKIKDILEVPDREFEKYKFSIVMSARIVRELENDENAVVNLSEIGHTHITSPTVGPFLGIDHMNKSRGMRGLLHPFNYTPPTKSSANYSRLNGSQVSSRSLESVPSSFGQSSRPEPFSTNEVTGDASRTVVMRLEPQPTKPNFMRQVEPPRAIAQHVASPAQAPASVPQPQSQQPNQRFVSSQAPSQSSRGVPPPTVAAQQPILPTSQSPNQQFVPREMLCIPGLTGNHPNGFAGAVQELRAAGIPVQGLPVEHVGGQPIQAPQSDVLVQANPNFANELNNLMNEAKSGGPFHASQANVPLPDAKPGDNGLIGLLSSSIRKLVKDSGMAEALSQGIPSVLGTGTEGQSGSGYAPKSSAFAASTDSDTFSGASADQSASAAISSGTGVRRQQTAAEKALSGFASALGGGGNSPTHAGLPRIPGIPLLPGGIPRNSQGQIDVVNLIGSITRRVSNGTTLADVLPPDQLQTLADNVTDALLPSTPEDFDLNKFMGRWFEGINSPRATEQRCVVHHYGGLTKNDKTATFTALKIYREGSELAQ
uniref:ubiquitinyl hydrolase 1 n=1 Tax=Ditylenchus dipsaci TaxID=166011 RepID=A0A915EIB7_9BILA